MLLRRIFVAAPLLAAAALLAACGQGGQQAAGETRELIFNTYLPPHEPMRRISIEDFAKRIEQESGGSLKVTIPGASLAPPNHQWGVVTDGVADMAMVSVFSNRGELILPQIAELPLNATTGEAASSALWATQQKYFNGANEFSGVKLLSMHVLPPSHLMSTQRPVTRVQDFSGMKIWASAGAPTTMARALGAVPVQSEFLQLFEYVSKGSVDAAMIGPGTIVQASLGDHVKHMTRFEGGLASTAWAVIMNQDTWNSLTEAQKGAVTRAAEGLPGRTGRATDERNAKALQDLKLPITDATPELMAHVERLAAGMRADWIAKAQKIGVANAAEAFDFYRAQLQQPAAAAAPAGGGAAQ